MFDSVDEIYGCFACINSVAALHDHSALLVTARLPLAPGLQTDYVLACMTDYALTCLSPQRRS